jgi:dipeptide transport system substrate-binding protein
MWPLHSWAHFKDLEGTIGYNLEKAKALLKEAGLEKGFETEIMTSSKQMFGLIDIAQILQADLRKIGVNAKIADIEPAIYNTRLQQKRDFGIAADTYGRASRDPGTLVTAAKSWYTDKEGGKTRFESAEWDQLRIDLQSTLDQEKRKAICRRLQEMALDECFTILIAANQRPWVLGSCVRGFAYDLDNSPFVDGIWLER